VAALLYMVTEALLVSAREDQYLTSIRRAFDQLFTAVAALLYMVTEELLVSAHEDGFGHRWWVDIQVTRRRPAFDQRLTGLRQFLPVQYVQYVQYRTGTGGGSTSR
jgi:hypothetical protein